MISQWIFHNLSLKETGKKNTRKIIKGVTTTKKEKDRSKKKIVRGRIQDWEDIHNNIFNCQSRVMT